MQMIEKQGGADDGNEDDLVRGISEGAENVDDNRNDNYDDGDNSNITDLGADQLVRMSEAENTDGYEIYDDIVRALDNELIVRIGDEVKSAQEDDEDEDNDNSVAAEDDDEDSVATEDDEDSVVGEDDDNVSDSEDEIETAEIVEANSDGTGDSSAGSNAEEMWPEVTRTAAATADGGLLSG